MEKTRRPNPQRIDPDRWLRLKLITTFNGDVTRAAIALAFVNGNPEADEEYRRFKQWEQEKFREYCQANGIEIGTTQRPTAEEIANQWEEFCNKSTNA